MARRQLRSYLEALGYGVTEHPFQFLPGALNAFPLLGAGLVWLALLQLPLLLLPGVPGVGAPVVWFTGAAAISLLAWRIGSGLPIAGAEQRDDANLMASRPDAAVRRWIVAHVDSKAQGHSMAGRLVAVWLLILAATGLTILVLLRWGSAVPPASGWVIGTAALATAAGGLSARGRLRGGSAGARDNGSGVLAVLIAAGQNRDPATGFIFTGAEEFGLVGARILARSGLLQPGVEIINVDTLDSRGAVWVVHHDHRGALLAHRLGSQTIVSGAATRRRRLPVGILTDSLAFARAGHPAVTLARLNWATLRLLHTAADRADTLDLGSAEQVGAYLAKLPPV